MLRRMSALLTAGLLVSAGSAALADQSRSSDRASRGDAQPLSLASWGEDDQDAAAGGDSSAMSEKESTTSVYTESSTAEDAMEDIQSFNTWTSLEDGQPGQRGELQFNYFNGWETSSGESDPWNMLMEIEYSPNSHGKCWFLDNAKFGIDVPLELMNGGVDGNGDIEVFWKQRLLREQEGEWWPTISLENEIRLPSGYHSSGVDYFAEGVIAKNVGPGTAVFNAFLKSANGHNNLESTSWWERSLCDDDSDESLRHFQWGFRLGYKWRINEKVALIADYVNQSSELEGDPNQNIGEVSAEFRLSDHLTIGPGIMFGLDGHEETPNFGAGVLVHYSIGD